MALKEVLFSTCDKCGAEEQTDIDRVIGKKKKNKTILPTGWIHVYARSAFADDLFSIDLCGKCALPVLDTAGLIKERR